MAIVYYIGGPADLTKRNHSERLYQHDYVRFPLSLPIMPRTPAPFHHSMRYSNYRLQQIGTDLFVGIYDKDSE